MTQTAEEVSGVKILEINYCKARVRANRFSSVRWSSSGQHALTNCSNKLDSVWRDTFPFYLLPKQPSGSEGFWIMRDELLAARKNYCFLFLCKSFRWMMGLVKIILPPVSAFTNKFTEGWTWTDRVLFAVDRVMAPEIGCPTGRCVRLWFSSSQMLLVPPAKQL